MRRKPKYNNMWLVHIDNDGNERSFQCNEVTANVNVAFLINMPVSDTGSRYITSSDIDFEIDDKLILGDEIKRITGIPELRPKNNNNTRRGIYSKDKVIVTT